MAGVPGAGAGSRGHGRWREQQRGLCGGKLPRECSLLAHAADIDDLLEGLDGVLEDGLDGLHDTEAALHIVDLGLHALDGLHLASDLDEGLAVIESLEDAGSEGLLDVLDGSGLGDGSIGIAASLRLLGLVELGLKGDKELVLVHGLVSFHGLEKSGIVVVVVAGGNSDGSKSELHWIENIIN